jgi:hypothetical protein
VKKMTPAGRAGALNRRNVAAVTMAGALSFGVGACGDTPVDHDTASTKSAAATAPADSGATAQKPTVEKATFTADAVRVFGRAKVDAGYREMVEFALENSFQDDRLRGRNGNGPSAYASVTSRMTPSLRDSFNDSIRRSIKGDEDEGESVSTIAFGEPSKGVILPKSGPIAVNQSITSPKVEVDRTNGTPRLGVTVTQRANLRIIFNGKPGLVAARKTVTYWLVEDRTGSGKTWLIDGYDGRWHADAPVPESR